MIKKTSFRGGDTNAAPPNTVAPYNPQADPGYQQGQQTLANLQGGLNNASRKMTPAEIMASLPTLQAQLLQQQQTAPQAAPNQANWGAVNNRVMPQQQPNINPVFAPQYQGGMYNGPNSVDPSTLKTPAERFTYIAGLLGSPGGGR